MAAVASWTRFANSSGVSMDLIQATRHACHMVGVWGMGPDPLDPVLSRKPLGDISGPAGDRDHLDLCRVAYAGKKQPVDERRRHDSPPNGHRDA